MNSNARFFYIIPVILGLGLTAANAAQVKQPQSLSFGPAPSISAHSSGHVTATASSGLTVVLTTKTPAVCTLGGNTVNAVKAGICTLVAHQAGNAGYAPAPQAMLSFNISAQANSGSEDGNGGGNGNGSNGGSKLAVTAPFNCNTLASSGNAAADGRRAYVRLNCVSCHGQDASGGMGPNIQGSGGDVAEAVKGGDGAMPAFTGFLCANDVTDLAAYLNSYAKTKKYLDWDVHAEKLLDGTAAPAPTGVVPGP